MPGWSLRRASSLSAAFSLACAADVSVSVLTIPPVFALTRISWMLCDLGVAMSNDYTSAPCSRSSSELSTVPEGTLASAIFCACAWVSFA